MYERYKCDYCKARLDPGEHCKCREKLINKRKTRKKADEKFDYLQQVEWAQLELKIHS